ncbi:MAG: peptidylprolyl isomerase [Ignavibacteriae bacterium]|nr:peptidylprolyl isomerase [Ignavibacteriota bacterium]
MTKAFAIFAGVFVVYIVLDWGMDLTGRKQASRNIESQEIGNVNGHSISAKDFAELVRQAAENQKAQTGQELDENQLRTLRDQIWNQVVEEKLFEDEIARLGISVTDQEIIDWVKGDNPPAFLVQQFTDSTGTFNRAAYDNAIQNPQNAQIWVKVEDYLRKQRQREKLQSMIMAGTRVTENEILQRFIDQNIKYDADCILFDPNVMVKDEEVTVTDDDMKKVYNENSEEFKQEATRKLKYVNFPVAPSAADTEAVMNEMADLKRKASEGADFVELAKTYSETPVAETFFKHGELNPDKETSVFAANAGDVIGPTTEPDGYHLIKVLEFKEGADEFVRASHILVNIENNDSVKALKEAKDIFAKTKTEDFAQLAVQFSKDGSAAKGGDLGWFGKGRMVKPFEDAAFKAKVGQIVGPVKSQFGYHIIKVTAKDKREVKIADIHMQVRLSSSTRENILQQAQDLAYISKESGDLLKHATELNFQVTETQSFQKDAVIPGIGMHSGLSKFAFTGKLGDVSDVQTLPNGGYGVFMISDIKDAGLRPFEELKTTLEPRVKREKKMEKIKSTVEQVRQQFSPSDSLSKISIIKPGFTAQNLRQFSLNGFVPNIGRDLKFSGAVSKMNVGELSGVVEGQRGYYIVKLLSKSNFDSTAYNAQKNNLRTQLMSERRNKAFSDWSTKLKKNAEIVDNRDMWYR